LCLFLPSRGDLINSSPCHTSSGMMGFAPRAVPLWPTTCFASPHAPPAPSGTKENVLELLGRPAPLAPSLLSALPLCFALFHQTHSLSLSLALTPVECACGWGFWGPFDFLKHFGCLGAPWIGVSTSGRQFARNDARFSCVCVCGWPARFVGHVCGVVCSTRARHPREQKGAVCCLCSCVLDFPYLPWRPR
jgi:hypothetical protein